MESAYPITASPIIRFVRGIHVGLFDTSIIETNIATFSKLVHITNALAPLDDRVRSYLDSNCAQCHRPGGAQAFFDARYDTPLINQGIINGLLMNSLGIEGARVVKPGDTNSSILFQRDMSLGDIKMPPLAKNMVDTDAVGVIAQWINTFSSITNSLTGSLCQCGIGKSAGGVLAIERANRPRICK